MNRYRILFPALFLGLLCGTAACHEPAAPDATRTTASAGDQSTASPTTPGQKAPADSATAEGKSRQPEWKKLANVFGIKDDSSSTRPAAGGGTREVKDITIATASTGQNSGRVPAVSAAPSAPRPQPASVAVRPAPGGTAVVTPGNPATSRPSSSGSGPSSTSTQPIDPNSDRTPPTFVGATFMPAQISDGEVATLTVTATDDLAGVRDISGVVTSPNGKAVLGFFCQPSGQPDVYGAKVTIPKNADRGAWYMGTIYLVDKANNGRNFSFTASTTPARLQVVSQQADSTPPVLRSVRVEKQSISEGEVNHVTVDADDDASGIKSISGIFLSPTKSARIGFGGRPQTTDGVWSGDIVLPKGADCGTWTLQQVELLDGADNRAIFSVNDPLVNGVSFLFVGSSCDSDAPVLESLTLNPPEVDNGNDSEITVTAVVIDDKTGVAGVSGRVDGPPSTSGQRATIYFSLSGNRDEASTPWVGKIRIAKFTAAGTWHVGSLQVIDRANNIRIYGPNDRQLAGAQFNVR